MMLRKKNPFLAIWQDIHICRRSFIKETLKKHYGENIYIIQIKENEPEVVFGANAIKDKNKAANDEQVLKHSALKIREAVLEYEKNITMSWPPNHQQLIEEEKRIPSSMVRVFFETLLKDPKHRLTSRNIIKSK